jgi:hypothetical protein
MIVLKRLKRNVKAPETFVSSFGLSFKFINKLWNTDN